MRACSIVLLATGSILTNSASAFATGDLVSPFRTCGKITEDKARLACFDEAVASLDTREAVARESAQERAEAEYGLKEHETARRTEKPSPDASDVRTRPVMDELQSRVAEVFVQDMTGKHILILENGQMWRETDVSTFRGRPRPGMGVSISKGKIGGYRLKADGKSGFMGVTRIK